jgi:hypothetical protein
MTTTADRTIGSQRAITQGLSLQTVARARNRPLTPIPAKRGTIWDESTYGLTANQSNRRLGVLT